MIAILHDWQDLASGVLALIAGAFIFLQGAVERSAMLKAQRAEAEKDRRQTHLILQRLEQAAAELEESIERFIENLEDVLGALDRGDDGIQLPGPIIMPKIFEVIFAQLTTREASITIYIELSALMEQGVGYNEDFRRFLVSYGQTVIEHRPIQPRLPFSQSGSRLPSGDPVAQTLLISTRSLQDRVKTLRSQINEDLDGGQNGSDIRPSDGGMGKMQPFEGAAGDRKASA